MQNPFRRGPEDRRPSQFNIFVTVETLGRPRQDIVYYTLGTSFYGGSRESLE